MGVKRYITLVILLLANMVLLAHAILPHTHHDGVVCFSLEDIKDQHSCSKFKDISDCCDGHETAQSSHHHHNSEDCDLRDVIIRQDTNHEEIIPCEACLSLLYDIYSLNELFLVAPEYEERLAYKPYLISYISPYVGSTIGLRAPPVSYFLG